MTDGPRGSGADPGREHDAASGRDQLLGIKVCVGLMLPFVVGIYVVGLLILGEIGRRHTVSTSREQTALVCVQYPDNWYSEYNVFFRGACPVSIGGAGHYETWWTK